MARTLSDEPPGSLGRNHKAKPAARSGGIRTEQPRTTFHDAREAIDARYVAPSAYAFAIAVIVQLVVIAIVTPAVGNGVFEPEATVIALSNHGILAVLAAGFDVALFTIAYLLASRHGWRLITVPVVAVVVTTIVYLCVLFLAATRPLVGGIGWKTPVPTTHGMWIPLTMADVEALAYAGWLWRGARQRAA